ncbi:CmcI family methyltransferase [Rhizobium sp. LjRoot98]|uniref:cephalosporin hydroxylase family protein n=1 Tax=unclassified Rhizobium TaxID=2613769 RepID=UPI000715AC39|nr:MULTISPECIES: CmcI family methyltransferase [unclassified Rhizobium]KQV41984.1 cephalosporin hydroxylase [Rhizobium sp. Root1204]KQY18483.1 cephalosporin hydroxylase [Rhizobium sp. Root1334]KRC13733.1 cephalosporin hydroxylase [Rhizobium sp. Root73]
MTTKDDRQEFEAHKQEMCLALGKDTQLFKQSLDTMIALDTYDYSYLWSWMGVPIIQLPADIMATQEIIWNTRPDIIIETGVARGGSMIFMASLLAMTGNDKGKVIGVDIDIRAHNRDAIETHPMASRIALIEGGSVDGSTLQAVRDLIPDGARVMVVLDSDHSYDHVLAECRAYGPLVTPGCYLVVADTAVGHVEEEQSPKKRSKSWFRGNDPLTAVNDYLQENDRFQADPVINGKLVLASSPGGYCIRLPDAA